MKKPFILLWFLFAAPFCHSQQQLTLSESETRFLENNLYLLAAHYTIDAAKALTIQAKIWENPVFTASFNAYNPSRNQYFDTGKNGQKAFSIEQLIYLGGKKRLEINVAKANEQLSELEFRAVLRTLKLELRRTFYTVYFNTKTLQTTDNQISRLQDLISSYQIQAQKGNVPLKDLIRLQSLFLNFKNERMELTNAILEQQAVLKNLLGSTETIVPIATLSDFEKYTSAFVFDQKELEKMALENRPDFLQRQKAMEANLLNVKLQQSLAIPDLTLGVGYDQNSGAFRNQTEISIGIPLPLWNKNKGTIQQSKAILEQSKVEHQNAQLELQSEVAASYSKWLEAKTNYVSFKSNSNDDAEQVYQGILDNFKNQNVSLLEFTDFMESYNQAAVQLNEMKKNLVLSAENLNTCINKELF